MPNDTILLVEDNADDVDLTLIGFRRSQIANPVAVARDGQEALDYLFGTEDQPPKPRPTVIILDLNMPRVPGLEVLRAIRADERTKLIPVIVLTTSREESDVIDSYRLGTNAYVQKPIGFEEFLEAARTLGLFWLVVNVPPTG